MTRIMSRRRTYQRQADATLSQSNPVSGTLYTVLDTTTFAKIHSIQVAVTWTVQPTPLQVHVTLDGNTIVHSFTDPVSADDYYPVMSPSGAENAQGMITSFGATCRDIYEGKSIKIEVETTGGTTSTLASRVKYSRLI